MPSTTDPLPEVVCERVLKLTRRARRARSESDRQAALATRDRLLEEHGYYARLREDDAGPVLVCYPQAWREGGTVDPDAIESLDAAVELPLTGSDTDASWEIVESINREIADHVAETYGPVHGATAAAFARYLSSHHSMEITDATVAQIEEFRAEFFPRNAWPEPEQWAVINRSLKLMLRCARRRNEET